MNARNQNSFNGGSQALQNSGTRIPQLMNTSGFHQNVGGALNEVSPQTLTLF